MVSMRNSPVGSNATDFAPSIRNASPVWIRSRRQDEVVFQPAAGHVEEHVDAGVDVPAADAGIRGQTHQPATAIAPAKVVYRGGCTLGLETAGPAGSVKAKPHRLPPVVMGQENHSRRGELHRIAVHPGAELHPRRELAPVDLEQSGRTRAGC